MSMKLSSSNLTRYESAEIIILMSLTLSTSETTLIGEMKVFSVGYNVAADSLFRGHFDCNN